MAAKKVNPGVVWSVSVMLTLVFGAVGIALLWRPDVFPTPLTNDDSTGMLFRRGLGALFCLGAALLLVPRMAWVGALGVSAILVGVIGYSLFQGKVVETLIPLMFLVSLGTLAYVRRPGGPFSAPKEVAPTTPPLPANAPPPSAPTGSGPPTV